MRQLIFFVLLVIISLFKGNAQTSDFIADTLTGCVPMQVTFTDLSAGNPVAWEWIWGTVLRIYMCSIQPMSLIHPGCIVYAYSYFCRFYQKIKDD
jgi:hypothetical protein